jgi:hypothetical protein
VPKDLLWDLNVNAVYCPKDLLWIWWCILSIELIHLLSANYLQKSSIDSRNTSSNRTSTFIDWGVQREVAHIKMEVSNSIGSVCALFAQGKAEHKHIARAPQSDWSAINVIHPTKSCATFTLLYFYSILEHPQWNASILNT